MIVVARRRRSRTPDALDQLHDLAEALKIELAVALVELNDATHAHRDAVDALAEAVKLKGDEGTTTNDD